MSSHCNNQCDRYQCPFVANPSDPHHYACPKCEKDYYFPKHRFPSLLLLWVLIVAILLLVHNPNSEIEAPEIKPTSQEVNLKR